jgi:hypothetical protein
MRTPGRAKEGAREAKENKCHEKCIRNVIESSEKETTMKVIKYISNEDGPSDSPQLKLDRNFFFRFG